MNRETPATVSLPAESQPARSVLQRKWLRPLLILLVVIVAGLAGLWLLGRLRPPELHGTVLQSPDIAADFTLTSTDGQPLSLSDLRGRWTALYFGYSFCPDVCPTTLADLRMAVQLLGDRAEDLNVAFVSLDPARDTPERLGEFLSHFNPDFIGLTGDPAAIDAVATQFGVFYEVREVEGASGYLVDHTSTVIVFDPDGRPRIVFPFGVKGADMAADIEWFMRRG